MCLLKNLTILEFPTKIFYRAYIFYFPPKFFFYVLLCIIVMAYLYYFYGLIISLCSKGLILGFNFIDEFSPKLSLSNFFNRVSNLCSSITLSFLVHLRRSFNLRYSFSRIHFIVCYSMYIFTNFLLTNLSTLQILFYVI